MGARESDVDQVRAALRGEGDEGLGLEGCRLAAAATYEGRDAPVGVFDEAALLGVAGTQDRLRDIGGPLLVCGEARQRSLVGLNLLVWVDGV